MGISEEQFFERFHAANLIDRFPGKAGKGDRFPMAEARNAAAGLDLSNVALLVMLGKNVARAFGASHAGYFEPLRIKGIPAVVIPHPSGVNRWWNAPENVERASAFLKNIISAPSPKFPA